jgi:saccharopine dehydrogenase (NAD+, L-lysine forming)
VRTHLAMSELRDALGILKETKNRFERRVPLIPEELKQLIAEGIEVRVERSPNRAFEDHEFEAVGCVMVDDATDCRFIMGVKEVKTSQVKPGQTVMCFSHTIKGQSHNMPLLQHFLDVGASLVDYEVVVDDQGVRQVAFGRYAGLAGAHETLWTLGHRMRELGHDSPLSLLKHAVDYKDLRTMADETWEAVEALRREGPEAFSPLVVAVSGEGRVSRGALEYLEMVGAIPCTIDEAVKLPSESPGDRTLRALHLLDSEIYERANRKQFDFKDYVTTPGVYFSKLAMYLPYCVAYINGSYWDERFPRVLDDSTLRRMYANGTLPEVLGDVACDIDGGIEWTVMATQNDEPTFVYNPKTKGAKVGIDGEGVAIMSVDNLPTALPRDASVDFSKALIKVIRPFFKANLRDGLGALTPAQQNAVVVAAGKLGPKHTGLQRFL